MLQDRVFPTCEQGGRGKVEMKRSGGDEEEGWNGGGVKMKRRGAVGEGWR